MTAHRRRAIARTLARRSVRGDRKRLVVGRRAARQPTPRSAGLVEPGGSALVAALVAAVAPGGASALDARVPAAVWRAALVGPAAEFLARPGKDLRARLVRTGWLLAGGAVDSPRPDDLARVLEILHAGSLIVDDIEDAGTERRGAPALHLVVGEPLAINTGSWMYFWALAELARLAIPGAVELAIEAVVQCHQGQALDLATTVDTLAMRDVVTVVAATTRLKTGALCRLATELGALAAGATPRRRAAIGDFGEHAGCALQMLDDLGSLAAPARRAKGHEDLRARRPTWPWAWLAADPLAWSRLARELRRAASPLERAVDQLARLDALAGMLAEVVEPTGRLAIRARLDAALAALAFAPAPIVSRIATELRTMEEMYG